MARIALLGYGRMGKQIEALAQERGHEIVARLDSLFQPHPDRKLNADVAIDYSRPEAAESLCKWSLSQGIPTLSGTTGWNSQAIKELCAKEQRTAFLHSSNTSIGVNVMFILNRVLAKALKNQAYSAHISETHHVHKLDAPSGTAITLAEGILASDGKYHAWTAKEPGEQTDLDQLPIASFRKGEIIGTHEVVFESEQDKITLRHEAFNRDGFALGAILAAEFLIGKRGVFSMADVLGLEQL